MKNLISLFILMVLFQCHPANNRKPLLDLAKTQGELSAVEFLTLATDKYKLNDKQQTAALGAFVRVQKKEHAIELLGKLVATKTFFNPDTEPGQNPEFKKAAAIIKSFCKQHQLKFSNHYGKIYEVTLDGSAGSPLAIYTHLDTVAAIAENWVMPDKTAFDPFELNRVEGKLYGRGAEDDKGSIASALTAMSVIATLPKAKRPMIRLFIETTEETGGGGFKYYLERNKIPKRNIVLDSRYPVVVAEKGYGTLSLFFEIKKPGAENLPQVVFFRGGMARNQIPGTAAFKIAGGQLASVSKVIQENSPKWNANFGKEFSLTTEKKGDQLWLTCKGISAHASAPQDGLNPVSRCLHIIDDLHKEQALVENAYTQAAALAVALFGLNETGEKMQINYQDSFMGPFTAAVTFLQQKDNKLELAVNLRAPKGRPTASTKEKINAAITAYQAKNGLPSSWNVSLEEPMTRNPDQPWIKELLTIFEEVTGKPGTPRAESGATTARQIPNAVNFGPAMPGEKYRGHTALEYKTEQNLEYDLQMFTEMMMRIPGLDQTR